MSANIDLFTRAAIRGHNFEAVPRNLAHIIDSIDSNKTAKPFLELFSLPHTKAASEAYRYAKAELTTSVMNHCLRMYHFGLFIASDFFSDWNLNQETWLMACLLHDIGSTHTNQHNSLLSSEFNGGMISRAMATSWGCPSEQCDAIAEAIMRQRDIDRVGKGKITRLGAMLQLVILYDNANQYSMLIHDTTLETVLSTFPKLKWDKCVLDAAALESDIKPWGHASKIEKQELEPPIDGPSSG